MLQALSQVTARFLEVIFRELHRRRSLCLYVFSMLTEKEGCLLCWKAFAGLKKIVNISVGSVKKQKENSQLVQAVESLWDSGLVICSAAGNEGMQQHNITSPGISRKIITVGSCDDKEMIDEGGRFYHNYSGRGPTIACICKPEIVAPGTNIVATNAMKWEDDRPYTVKSGTSMSTPMVSGAAALLLERYPKMTNTNVKLKLWKSAKNLGLPRSHQGWGQLDISHLLE